MTLRDKLTELRQALAADPLCADCGANLTLFPFGKLRIAGDDKPGRFMCPPSQCSFYEDSRDLLAGDPPTLLISQLGR